MLLIKKLTFFVILALVSFNLFAQNSVNDWTFENAGQVITNNKLKLVQQNKVYDRYIENVYIESEKERQYLYLRELVDLSTNKVVNSMLFSSDHNEIKEPEEFFFYSKNVDKLYRVDYTKGITEYDLKTNTPTVLYKPKDNKRMFKSPVNEYGKFLGRSDVVGQYFDFHYNPELNQFYWYIPVSGYPSEFTLAVYDLNKKKMKKYEYAYQYKFDPSISTNHIYLGQSNNNEYLDCTTFKLIGTKLPNDVPRLSKENELFYYDIQQNIGKITIFSKGNNVASILVPQKDISFVYIDSEKKNVLYYGSKNNIDIYLNTKDSISFEQNLQALKTKKSNNLLGESNYWEENLNAFRKLNFSNGLLQKSANLVLKENYFSLDTNNLFSKNRAANSYPYQIDYSNKNSSTPFKILKDGIGFNYNYKPSIHNLTDASCFLVFGNNVCLANAVTKQMKFFECTLGNEFHQIDKEIYLINNKYICDVVANKVLKELVYLEGDYQLHYVTGDYLKVAQLINETQTLLQVFSLKDLTLVNQELIDLNLFSLENNSFKEFDFYKDKISCKFSSNEMKLIYSKKAIVKSLDDENLAQNLLNDNVQAETQEKDVKFNNNATHFNTAIKFNNYNNYIIYNHSSNEYKDDNYDIFRCVDIKVSKLLENRVRFKIYKNEIVEAPVNNGLVARQKLIMEKCTLCNGQKSSGGEYHNCQKCNGSGLDPNTKCMATGCVYGYQTKEEFKTKVDAINGAWITYTEKTKVKCTSCLGTQQGMCKECKGKGGNKTETINCTMCKGSGYTNKMVDND